MYVTCNIHILCTFLVKPVCRDKIDPVRVNFYKSTVSYFTLGRVMSVSRWYCHFFSWDMKQPLHCLWPALTWVSMGSLGKGKVGHRQCSGYFMSHEKKWQYQRLTLVRTLGTISHSSGLTRELCGCDWSLELSGFFINWYVNQGWWSV